MRIVEIRMKGAGGAYRCADTIELSSGDSPRQICLADAKALKEARTFTGLCTQKFNADLITEGLDYAALKTGCRLHVGTAELEITDTRKRCFDECPLRQAGITCQLHGNCAFAHVVSGGIARCGMSLSLN
ncbi:MAG: hypothetical protein VB064_06075 [Oscillospiraceae bacterium]|nr:hypothetical protein [Oscillospiraceae bacterium]